LTDTNKIAKRKLPTERTEDEIDLQAGH
jgi:hypothetical protein